LPNIGTFLIALVNRNTVIVVPLISAVVTTCHKYKPQATLCKHETLIDDMVSVSYNLENPLHTRCLEILCQLTRFPYNNPILARKPSFVDGIIFWSKSAHDTDRVYSMRILQNLTSDLSNRGLLATPSLLESITASAMRNGYEQESAVAALVNLTTEPCAIVPITSTKHVIATLVHIAHNPKSPEAMCAMACECLAAIGLWLQKLSLNRSAPSGNEQVILPTQCSTGWMRWD